MGVNDVTETGITALTDLAEAALRALSIDDWKRDCRIDQKAHTVFSRVRRMVLHEREHCDQIEAMLR